MGRGFRAMAAANLTFGVLLVALALGLSVATPSGVVLRGLKVAGGAFLLWLAVEGLRSSAHVRDDADVTARRTLPPAARGVLAVLLNPGAWLFLAAVASPLLGTATRDGGTGGALLVVVALLTGVSLGDTAVVLLGGVGVRKGGARVEKWVRRGLAVLLAALGVWLLWSDLVP